MTERMRQRADDALAIARELAARGYLVTIEPPVRATWTVRVTPSRFRLSYFDGGCLDDCFAQIRLEDFPARAA